MAVETTPPLFPLQGSAGFNQTLPTAKYVKTEREYVANYFLVKETDSNNVDTWHYYPVKISKEKKGNFYKLEVAPPVLKEGVVCIDKSFIHVPLNDLIRRHINVTRVEPAAIINNTKATSEPAVIKLKPNLASEQSGTGELVSNEDRKNIDLAFKDQIDALHYLEDSEEGGW